MTLLLKNATVVRLHPPQVRESTDVAIDGGLIAAVGAGAAATRQKPDRTIDLAGKILMPGLVCGHTHFYSALARGMLARIEPSSDFVSTLQNLWWRLDRAIDREILEASALAAALEAVQRGCTSVVDHHASPSFIEGSLDVIAGCLERVGLRGVLCYETTDRNGSDGAVAGIEENHRFARRVEAQRRTRAPRRGTGAPGSDHRRPCAVHARRRDARPARRGRAGHRPWLPRARVRGCLRRFAFAPRSRTGSARASRRARPPVRPCHHRARRPPRRA